MTIDMCVALDFRGAILFQVPSLFGINRVAAHCTRDRLWFLEEHLDLQATV